jgi:hypothetical protein
VPRVWFNSAVSGSLAVAVVFAGVGDQDHPVAAPADPVAHQLVDHPLGDLDHLAVIVSSPVGVACVRLVLTLSSIDKAVNHVNRNSAEIFATCHPPSLGLQYGWLTAVSCRCRIGVRAEYQK